MVRAAPAPFPERSFLLGRLSNAGLTMPCPPRARGRRPKPFTKAVLRRVVESEGLVDDPDFRPGSIGRMIGALGSVFHAGSSQAQDPTDFVVEAFARRIAVKRSERTYIVDVDVTASTPEKAVKLGNALVAAYFRVQTALS